MAHRRTLRSALSALGIGAMIALSACGGAGTAAPPTPDASGSATPTADSRPTPASSTAPARNIPVPELPQAATQNTKEGFKAFVEHYIALLDYAYQTGDTKPALAAAHPGCTMCNIATKNIDAAQNGGGWILGGTVTMSDFGTDGVPDIDGRWTAAVSLSQTAITNVRPGVSISTPAPATSQTLLAIADYRDGKWSMFDLGLPRGSRK